jgi:hypothetical protein
MKKIISIFLVLILCMAMVPSAFAADSLDTENNDVVTSITVSDENGNDVQYDLKNNSVTEIPIYGSKQSDGSVRSLGLEEVAVLTITVQYNTATFYFKPVGIALLTGIGFVGNFSTYNSGALYGYNSYALPVYQGFVSAPNHGTGSISGTYLALGYDPIHVFHTFAW